jgi:hypothetical protein
MLEQAQRRVRGVARGVVAEYAPQLTPAAAMTVPDHPRGVEDHPLAGEQEPDEQRGVLLGAARCARADPLVEPAGALERRAPEDDVSRAQWRRGKRRRRPRAVDPPRLEAHLEATVRLEPALREVVELERPDVADHRGAQRIGERLADVVEPPRVDDAVVVDERDQLAARRAGAARSQRGQRSIAGRHIPHRALRAERGGPGIVGGVVDDDDLRRGNVERGQAVEAPRQKRRTAAGAHNH